MLDWKILAASFAALLVISSVLVGSFGIGDFFSDITKKIGDLLGGSPFSGFLNNPSAKTSQVNISFFPENFTIKPNSPINISMTTTSFENFNGEIQINFENNSLIFKESNSPLIMNFPVQKTDIDKLKLNKIMIENAAFEVSPNITESNGTVEITDFFGKATIEEDRIKFQGNVSFLKIKIGDLELKSM